MADEISPPKKSGKLKWVLLIFLILLLISGGVGAWYYFFSDLPHSKAASEKAAGTSQGAAAVKTPAVQNLLTATLDPFVVNLADPLGKRYIRIVFEVEVTQPSVTEELVKQKAKIRDSIIMLLSSKTYADLAPAESKLALKTEVANRLNQILGAPKITRVFITEMVIQ